MDCQAAIAQIDQEALDALVKSINIPARPSVLHDFQREMAKDEPDLQAVARIASQDVALSAAVLRAANSAMYALPRKVESMGQAVAYLGLSQVAALLTGIVARRAINADGPMMPRFWDESTKRSAGVMHVTRALGGIDQGLAQTFGLFCDLGIPLLYQRFPGYTNTLQDAGEAATGMFTDVERAAHGTDHAAVGAMMARSWGLPTELCLAIRLHHDYSVVEDTTVPSSVRELVATGLLVEMAIRRHEGLSKSTEWDKGGEAASRALGLTEFAVHDLRDDLLDVFNTL